MGRGGGGGGGGGTDTATGNRGGGSRVSPPPDRHSPGPTDVTDDSFHVPPSVPDCRFVCLAAAPNKLPVLSVGATPSSRRALRLMPAKASLRGDN